MTVALFEASIQETRLVSLAYARLVVFLEDLVEAHATVLAVVTTVEFLAIVA